MSEYGSILSCRKTSLNISQNHVISCITKEVDFVARMIEIRLDCRLVPKSLSSTFIFFKVTNLSKLSHKTIDN